MGRHLGSTDSREYGRSGFDQTGGTVTAGENRWNLGSWSRLLDLLEARTPKVAGGSTAVEIAGFAGARTPKVAGGSTAVVIAGVLRFRIISIEKSLKFVFERTRSRRTVRKHSVRNGVRNGTPSLS